jgi:hypothetical protein
LANERAGIHRADQQHPRRVGDGALGAADRDVAVLQRLAQDVQAGGAELRQFVQEEDAAMGQAQFARPGEATAADQAGVADGVVRGAEGALPHER